MGSVVGEDDPFYNKYKDHQLIWPSLPGMGIMTCLALIGLVGNTSVAIVTYKNRNLRSNCNILLSMTCLGDSLHQCAHYPTTFILFTGLNFIRLRICFFIQILPLIGLNFGVILSFLIGVDRLVSVTFPVRYRRINFKLYMVFIVLSCSAYAFITIHNAYTFMVEKPDAMVTCLIVDAMPGYSGDFWFKSAVIFNFLTIITYTIVGIMLRIKTNANSSTRRIFKSLSAILTVIVVGWVLNSIVRIVLSSTHADPILFYHVGMYSGVFVNTACASNAFILYLFSQDYRQALRLHFNWITTKIHAGKIFSDTRPTDLMPSAVSSSARY